MYKNANVDVKRIKMFQKFEVWSMLYGTNI